MRAITVFLALLLAAVASPARAQPALLDAQTDLVRLTPHLGYAVDPDGRADAAAMFARVGRGEFEPLPDGSSTFGFTTIAIAMSRSLRTPSGSTPASRCVASASGFLRSKMLWVGRLKSMHSAAVR